MSAADLDRANLDAARLSEARNGPSRAYCRLYVSKDGGSDRPETPGAPRCWLQPGHDGRCQPSPGTGPTLESETFRLQMSDLCARGLPGTTMPR